MKKILLLGGSVQQVIAIKTAKRLGYYTILCDYLEDNMGQYHADRFYLISTTDKNAVLEIAVEEQINGILAYASDPAAPTAAYVAEKMGLPTNPYESVEILCNKDKFRAFLKNNGFNTPLAKGYSEKEAILYNAESFELPVIIKPVDSSGSKGVTVVQSRDRLAEAADFAFSFSKSHKIIIEKFIERKHEYLIGGDIFVLGGKIILWGLLNCHRDTMVNPLVPVGKSYPLLLEQEDKKTVCDTLQRMVDKLGIHFGAINVELVVDQDNKVWPIDIGPRAGGNMIPDLLGIIFGIDVVAMSVKAAMGEKIGTEISKGTGYYATHNLHIAQNGQLKEINFSPMLEKYIIKKCIYKKPNDFVEYFDNALKTLGIIFMKFGSEEEMKNVLDEINSFIDIKVCVERGGGKIRY